MRLVWIVSVSFNFFDRTCTAGQIYLIVLFSAKRVRVVHCVNNVLLSAGRGAIDMFPRKLRNCDGLFRHRVPLKPFEGHSGR